MGLPVLCHTELSCAVLCCRSQSPHEEEEEEEAERTLVLSRAPSTSDVSAVSGEGLLGLGHTHGIARPVATSWQLVSRH